jgi:hypothetical protein
VPDSAPVAVASSDCQAFQCPRPLERSVNTTALLVLHAVSVATYPGFSQAGPFWSPFEFRPQPDFICRSTLLAVGRDNGAVRSLEAGGMRASSHRRYRDHKPGRSVRAPSRYRSHRRRAASTRICRTYCDVVVPTSRVNTGSKFRTLIDSRSARSCTESLLCRFSAIRNCSS